MTWGSITTSLLPSISMNPVTHHFTVISGVFKNVVREHMEGRVLPEKMTSQIASPEHNQCSQGLYCLSPTKVNRWVCQHCADQRRTIYRGMVTMLSLGIQSSQQLINVNAEMILVSLRRSKKK